MNHTLCLIKPDALRRKLDSDIVEMFITNGFAICDGYSMAMSAEAIIDLYDIDEKWHSSVGAGAVELVKQHNLDALDYYGSEDVVKVGKKIADGLVNYLTRGFCTALLLKGDFDAVCLANKIKGKTFTDNNPNSIRARFRSSTLQEVLSGKQFHIENLLHTPEDSDEFLRQAKILFPYVSLSP